jgi:PPM family protein phosphatase
MQIQFGQATDKGKYRTNNQDAVLSLIMHSDSRDIAHFMGLFVVADGIGASPSGEYASTIVMRTLAVYINQHVLTPLAMGDALSPSQVTAALFQAFQRANHFTRELVPEGTACATAALIMDTTAHIAHVGDTRAYSLSPTRALQLTQDHTLAARLVKEGHISPQKAVEAQKMLARAFGKEEQLEVDVYTHIIEEETALLLCSDGVYNRFLTVDYSNLDEVVPLLRQMHDPQSACQRLVTLANQRGGYGNMSAILIARQYPFMR